MSSWKPGTDLAPAQHAGASYSPADTGQVKQNSSLPHAAPPEPEGRTDEAKHVCQPSASAAWQLAQDCLLFHSNQLLLRSCPWKGGSCVAWVKFGRKTLSTVSGHSPGLFTRPSQILGHEPEGSQPDGPTHSASAHLRAAAEEATVSPGCLCHPAPRSLWLPPWLSSCLSPGGLHRSAARTMM